MKSSPTEMNDQAMFYIAGLKTALKIY